MSNIELFGIFGFFVLTLFLMLLAYALVFGVYCVMLSSDWDDTDGWVATTLIFIVTIALIFTAQYGKSIQNNTVSENVVNVNVTEELKEQK